MNHSFFELSIPHQILMNNRAEIMSVFRKNDENILKHLNSDSIHLYAQIIHIVDEIPDFLIAPLIEIQLSNHSLENIYQSKITENLVRIFGFVEIEKRLQSCFQVKTDVSSRMKIMTMFINNHIPDFNRDDFYFDGTIATLPDYVWRNVRYYETSKIVDYPKTKPYIDKCDKLWKDRILTLSNYYLDNKTQIDEQKLLFMLIKRDIRFDEKEDSKIYLKARTKLDLIEK